MTEYRSVDYLAAKLVVQMNANGQARFDVETLAYEKAYECFNDPVIVVETIPILTVWVEGENGKLIFAGLNSEIYERLTPQDITDINEFWVSEYVSNIHRYIAERIERKGMYDSNRSG